MYSQLCPLAISLLQLIPVLLHVFLAPEGPRAAVRTNDHAMNEACGYEPGVVFREPVLHYYLSLLPFFLTLLLILFLILLAFEGSLPIRFLRNFPCCVLLCAIPLILVQGARRKVLGRIIILTAAAATTVATNTTVAVTVAVTATAAANSPAAGTATDDVAADISI